jgi:hypothetical protein
MQQPSPHLASFFGPWVPPPHFTPAPQDKDTKDRITLLAKYAMQNGAAFIDVVRTKQAGNVQYSFLTPGGHNHDFWLWALYATGTGLPLEQPPAAGAPAGAEAGSAAAAVAAAGGVTPPASAPPAPAAAPALPPDVASGFTQVLDALTGSKVSLPVLCRNSSSNGFLLMVPDAVSAATHGIQNATLAVAAHLPPPYPLNPHAPARLLASLPACLPTGVHQDQPGLVPGLRPLCSWHGALDGQQGHGPHRLHQAAAPGVPSQRYPVQSAPKTPGNPPAAAAGRCWRDRWQPASSSSRGCEHTSRHRACGAGVCTSAGGAAGSHAGTRQCTAGSRGRQ